MSTSGPEMHRALDSTLPELRQGQSAAGAELAETRQRLEGLLAQRSQALQQLAQHELPALTADAIAETFAGVRAELRKVLGERQHRLDELQQQEAATRQQLDQLDQQVNQTTAALNHQVAERTRLEGEVARRLAGDQRFQELSREAATAEQALARDEARSAELQAAADEKRPAYEASSLFTYLWRRKFGTAEYRGRGWFRRLDRRVAQLVDYQKARHGYRFLCVTPELVAQEVARRREVFEATMEQVEQLEDAAADALGLTPVLQRGEQLGRERAQQLAAMRERQAEADAQAEELCALERAQGEFYQRALRRMRDYLERAGHDELRREAAASAERGDDRMVAELGWLAREIDQLEPQLQAAQNRFDTASRRVVELDRLLQRFRAADFDSERAYFDDVSAGELHRDLAAGQLTAVDAWRRLEKNQRFASSWAQDAPQVIGNVLRSPASRVLLRAMGEVVGQALSSAATRGARRRRGGFSPRRRSAGRPRSGGGFTTTGGF